MRENNPQCISLFSDLCHQLAEVFIFFALVMIKIRKNGNEKEYRFTLCYRADS